MKSNRAQEKEEENAKLQVQCRPTESRLNVNADVQESRDGGERPGWTKRAK